MRTYRVTVRTTTATHEYSAIGGHSIDVLLTGMERFGPFCKVTVKAA